MVQRDHWKVKLAAWLHDPAEKALILLRGVPHDEVTVDKVLSACFPEGVSEKLKKIIKRADHWASGADRPTMPLPKGEQYPEWLSVKFWDADQAEIIHPITGQCYQLRDLYCDSLPNLEKLSLDSYLDIVAPEKNERGEKEEWPRKAFLRLWRLLPENDPLNLGHLWRLLPADTRVPTHTIWDHLSLTSALAGAMAADPEENVALFAVSLGPVQNFIQKAKSTSDLWAGSHLLSYLSWKAMEFVCERLGPDSILFPKLWGIPLCDLWLKDQGVPFDDLPFRPSWNERTSDSNPLFVAAVPNRFVAIVPASEAKEIGQRITDLLRKEALNLSLKAAEKLAKTSKVPDSLQEQINSQLKGFPEVYWAALPFRPFLDWDDKGVLHSDGEKRLEKALKEFFPCGNARRPGFLGTEEWNLLSRTIGRDDDVFVYRPNPGALYPAVYQLLDRVHSAVKLTRPFEQLSQTGFRCTLCGELEWLTTDRKHLEMTPGKRKNAKTLWTEVSAKNPSWARKGDHLCGLCALKRMWPDIFSDWVYQKLGFQVDRFVISTHALALATDLYSGLMDDETKEDLRSFVQKHEFQLAASPRVALPLKLHKELAASSEADKWQERLRRLPSWLDSLREDETSDEALLAESALRNREKIEKDLRNALGQAPEAYYSVLIMDGDHMGAWISGTPPAHMINYEDLFHSRTREGLRRWGNSNKEILDYLKSPRTASPAYHGSISSALNGFALHVVPHIVEELYLGKTIYAGGDDVLALLSVDDCLEAALTLRCAFSGVVPGSDKEAVWALLGWLKEQRNGLKDQIGRGFVNIGNRILLHTMGKYATASVGLVIAHQMTPLQLVLREARRAEQMAKKAGRNRLGIILIKRSGGATQLVVPFGFGGSDQNEATEVGNTPVGALVWLRDMLARPHMSRRAAYNVQQWLTPLHGMSIEVGHLEQLLATNLSWQLRRQWSGEKACHQEITELASALAKAAIAYCYGDRVTQDPVAFIFQMFSVAEFLARQGRARNFPRL